MTGRLFAPPQVLATPAEARALLAEEPDQHDELIASAARRTALSQVLAEHNAGAGSAARIERLAVLARPPDLDSGEITGKGHINQRRVLEQRRELIDRLYADPPPAGVVIAEGSAQR